MSPYSSHSTLGQAKSLFALIMMWIKMVYPCSSHRLSSRRSVLGLGDPTGYKHFSSSGGKASLLRMILGSRSQIFMISHLSLNGVSTILALHHRSRITDRGFYGRSVPVSIIRTLSLTLVIPSLLLLCHPFLLLCRFVLLCRLDINI
jgi:hypothetical protein